MSLYFTETISIRGVRAQLGRDANRAPQRLLYTNHESADTIRNNYISTQLIDHFMTRYGMTARQAEEEMRKELGRQYSPNPWDSSKPRKQTWREAGERRVSSAISQACATQGSESEPKNESEQTDEGVDTSGSATNVSDGSNWRISTESSTDKLGVEADEEQWDLFEVQFVH